jgi:hypothetical protein
LSGVALSKRIALTAAVPRLDTAKKAEQDPAGLSTLKAPAATNHAATNKEP